MRGLCFNGSPEELRRRNRIGFTQLSPAQLKIIQEVITLGVFVPFALLYMRQPVGWNFVRAGCGLPGAVYFMFT